MKRKGDDRNANGLLQQMRKARQHKGRKLLPVRRASCRQCRAEAIRADASAKRKAQRYLHGEHTFADKPYNDRGVQRWLNMKSSWFTVSLHKFVGI